MTSSSGKSKNANCLSTPQVSTGLWIAFVTLIILFGVVVGLYIADRNEERAALEEENVTTEAEALQQRINELQDDIDELEQRQSSTSSSSEKSTPTNSTEVKTNVKIVP